MKNNNILDLISQEAGTLASLIAGKKAASTAPSKRRDAQSNSQLELRSQVPNVMANSRILAGIIESPYENKPKKLSNHNMFVRHNLYKVKVYFIKRESAAKACVVAPFLITEGTLEPIELSEYEGVLRSNLYVPEAFEITPSTSLADVSGALLKANPTLMQGDTLQVVQVRRSFLGLGGMDAVPQAHAYTYKFRLDLHSRIVFYDLIPPVLFQVINNRISTGRDMEEGAAAYIHSRKIHNKTYISTQRLVLTPACNLLYKQYSSAPKKVEAIESYRTVQFGFFDPEAKLLRLEKQQEQVINEGDYIEMIGSRPDQLITVKVVKIT